MAKASELNERIFETVKELPEKEKREVLNFIKYLRIKEERSFIEYVNQRTKETAEAKKRGEHFTSLQELQQEYA